MTILEKINGFLQLHSTEDAICQKKTEQTWHSPDRVGVLSEEMLPNGSALLVGVLRTFQRPKHHKWNSHTLRSLLNYIYDIISAMRNLENTKIMYY